MILDRLDRLDRYTQDHPLLAIAAAWLAKPEHLALPCGKHAIHADSVYVIIEEGITREPTAGRFEAHRTHLDIQVNLSGGERIPWIPADVLVVEDDFQPGGDIAFYAEPSVPSTSIPVLPGHFVIFWPGEGHKPVCHFSESPAAYRKMVVKARVA
jgi:biofilm protein TabA